MLNEPLGTFNLSTWFIQRTSEDQHPGHHSGHHLHSTPPQPSSPNCRSAVEELHCSAAAGCPACAAAAADDRQRPILQPFDEVVIQLRDKEI